jgi:hypothetical protein
MAIDVFKPRGKLKKNQPGAGVASVIDVPIICTVMNTVDPTHQGRIAVYPSENLDKDAYNANNWLWVGRLASFAGQTAPIGPDEIGEYGSYTQNPSSYGQWNAPPDKQTQVICIFVNGDPNYGFYIGTIPKPETLSMIPAIGASENVTLNGPESASYGGATRLPTTNINTNNKDIADSVNYLKDAKPVHSFTASIMQQQGVLRDKYRGPIGSSATREASSRVGWGVSTPGRPVYIGGATDEDIAGKLGDDPQDFRVVTRRGGHSLVMDDGDIIGRDQLIRLRTSLGHQILMSDDGQMLSILHANGQSYIELGKEGTVDVFSTNSINLRTQGDLNLHADETLNLNAKNVNINASENTTLNTDKVFKQRVGEDYSLYALQNLKFKADAALAMAAGGQVGIKSDSEIFNEGTKIHLNDGAASLSPDEVEPIEVVMHPDTLFDAPPDSNTPSKGWAAALAKLPSITSRAPAHMPWMNANQGADVQVDPSAEGALPAEPPEAVADLNADLAGDLGGTTALTNPSTAATINEVGGISDAIDKNATTQMLGSIAQDTASDFGIGGTGGQIKAVLTDVVNEVTTASSTAVIGVFGQTPSQMAAGGILKPGADTMVNTLIAANAGEIGSIRNVEPDTGFISPDKLSAVMPSTAFTGKDGVNTLEQFTNSTGAQAKSSVQVLQKGQKALQEIKAISGKENSGGIGALVQGTATTLADKGNVAENAQDVGSIITSYRSQGSDLSVSGAKAQVLSKMKSGSSAMIASALSGAGGGIISALDTLSNSGLDLPGVGADLNIGAAASSFKSIVNSFPVLPADVPVDLVATAGAAAAGVAGASAGMTGLDLALADSIDSGLADALGDGPGAVGAITGALTSQAGAVAAIAASGDAAAVAAINESINALNASGVNPETLATQGTLGAAARQVQQGQSSKIAGTIASGVSQLPGGQKLAGAVVNNAVGAVNPIADGIDDVTEGMRLLGANAFYGNDPGASVWEGAGWTGLGNVKDTFSSMSKQLTGAIEGPLSNALSPGASAALQSALSSLTAGGGSTIKLPVVAVNTYDRSAITNAIDSVLESIVPRPNLLGEIPQGTLTAASNLLALRKELSKDIQTLSVLSKGIAKKQAKLFEVQTTFPAGSPEITAAQAAYDAAVTSPTYTNLVAKIEAAEALFADIDVDNSVTPATNPFSAIENSLKYWSNLQLGSGYADDQDGDGILTPGAEAVGPDNVDYFDAAIAAGVDGLNPNDYDDTTYSNILATIAKTFVPKKKTQYQTEPYSTDYTPVITGYPAPENTVESVEGEDIGDGPLTSDNSDADNVDAGGSESGSAGYTGPTGGGGGGVITINENYVTGIIGGSTRKWVFNGTTWVLR